MLGRTDFSNKVGDVVFSVIQITGVLSNSRDNRSDASGHISWPKGRTQGETIMRKFIISITTLAALTTFAGMSSAFTGLSETHFIAPMPIAHHQFRVKDTVRTVHPAHAALFAS
jgi:hypothetical protein